MTTRRFTPGSTIALALGVFMMMLAGAPTTSGQVSQPAKKLTLAYPKLEVKQFSGDFTQWGLTGSIEKGGSLTKEFRWSTNRSDVAAARYEIRMYDFPAPATYQAAFRLVSKTMLTKTLSPGAINYFTIDFTDLKPLIQNILSAKPRQLTFYIRLVLMDAQNKSLSPVSYTAKVHYTLPAGGTKLDHSMKLRLTKVECVRQTSGPGSDDIVVRILRASNSFQGTAKLLFSEWEANIPDDWELKPSLLLWEYRGLGFRESVYILAAVAEEDEDPIVAGFYSGQSTVPNSGQQTGKLIDAFRKELCELEDHFCLGSPQIVPVTQADWNKVALGGQTVTKLLRFAGDGGLYELTFELSPK